MAMVEIKSEPVFYGDNHKEENSDSTFYARGSHRGQSVSRQNTSVRSRRNQQGVKSEQSSSPRRQNPVGCDGKITNCIICG